MKTPTTPCQRVGCPFPGHVVLYAVGGEFDGQTHRLGETLVYCLKHGGELYDAIRTMTGVRGAGNMRVASVPSYEARPNARWLTGCTAAELPTVRSPWQSESVATGKYSEDSPYRRSQRTRATTPDRPSSRNYR